MGKDKRYLNQFNLSVVGWLSSEFWIGCIQRKYEIPETYMRDEKTYSWKREVLLLIWASTKYNLDQFRFVWGGVNQHSRMQSAWWGKIKVLIYFTFICFYLTVCVTTAKPIYKANGGFDDSFISFVQRFCCTFYVQMNFETIWVVVYSGCAHCIFLQIALYFDLKSSKCFDNKNLIAQYWWKACDFLYGWKKLWVKDFLVLLASTYRKQFSRRRKNFQKGKVPKQIGTPTHHSVTTEKFLFYL